MRTLQARRFQLGILVDLGALAMKGVVYANGVTGKDVTTESHFHLTSTLQLCRLHRAP